MKELFGAKETKFHIICTILDGFSVQKGDCLITDLSNHIKTWGDKPKVQVYKRRFRRTDKKGKQSTDEYNQFFSNYQEAVEKFLEISSER